MTIKEVEYVSVWNSNFEVRTSAKFNLISNEVFDIESSDIDVDADGDELEHLEGQYIQWKEHTVDVEEHGTKYFAQAADYVKEQMRASDVEELELHRMLTLSTAHITEQDAQFLDNPERAVLTVYEKNEYGWFIYLTKETFDEELKTISKTLTTVLRFAKGKGFDVLCLDRDGETINALEVFDW